jgi:hypothetical protein
MFRVLTQKLTIIRFDLYYLMNGMIIFVIRQLINVTTIEHCDVIVVSHTSPPNLS